MMAVSIIMGGGSFVSFWDTASVLMVFGGTTRRGDDVLFSLKNVLNLPKVLLKVFFNKPINNAEVIDANGQPGGDRATRRPTGARIATGGNQNPFIKLGIQMAVDGTRPEVIEDIMKTDIDSVAIATKTAKA